MIGRWWNVGRRAWSWAVPLAAAGALAAAVAPFLSSPVLSDELFTLEAARLDWASLWRHLQADVHPPLYYAAVKLWLEVLGHSLIALRGFSLLMALAAVAVASRVLPQPEPGRGWAAWFLAADGIFLVMAFYGRMYSMLALLCLLAWLASDQRLRRGARGWSALAAVTAAAGFCTHHFFGFFLAALAVWLALVHGRAFLRLWPEWSAGVAAWAVLWGKTAFEQFTQRPQHLAWVQPMSLARWAEVAAAHLAFAAAALPAALLALGFLPRRRSARWPAESRAAAVAALAALALPGLISVWKPVWNPRFTVIASPFLAAALAPLGPVSAGVWPVAATAAGGGWLWWGGSQTKCTSQAAARQLAAAATASDTVVFCRMTRKPVEYYWIGAAPQRRSFPAEIDAHPGYEGRQTEASLREEARQLARSAAGRVFVVADLSRPAPRILIEALEDAGFQRQPPLLECASAGKHYFHLLAVFDPPLKQTESLSAAPPAPGSPPRDPVARAYERR
jgi:hypothetical protein